MRSVERIPLPTTERFDALGSTAASPSIWLAPCMEMQKIGGGRLRFLLALLIVFGASALPSSVEAQTAYLFPSVVNVGSTSQVQTVSVGIHNAGTLGKIQVLTGGAPSLDYGYANSGTCSLSTSYSAGQSCTVAVTLSAKFPGARSGAVVLLDTNGGLMATQPLYGVGVGPLSVMSAGEITTVAGNGHLTATGPTGGQATAASISQPLAEAVDGAGNFYYTNFGNNTVNKVDPTGALSVIAGTNTAGFTPGGTPAVNASLNGPSAILVDGAGNIYFTESGNSTVREIVKATGILVTIAGTGTAGYSGDGGPASAAALNQPEGIAFDALGDLYIADTGNNVLRRIDAASGNISTVAGSLTAGFAGDGQSAVNGQFNQPWSIAFGSDGSLYIADFYNNRIRKIDPTGKLSTVVGTGVAAYSGDGGPALSATMDHPSSVVVDAAGDIIFSDSENNCVRKVNSTTQTITTLAGSGAPDSGGDGLNADDGIATLNKPYGLALDGSGDLFIADRIGLKVREVLGTIGRIQYKDIKVTNTSPAIAQNIENDGNGPLHLSAITPVANAAVDPATTTCSTTSPMAVGAECVIGVEFKPTIVGSPVSGSINVVSDSATSPVAIELTGNSLSIEPTSTTLASTPNPSAVGGAVTFTATVSSGSSQVTGTVQFFDGTTLLGGAAQLLNSSTRVATFTTTSLGLGSHSITAVYSGDNSNETSTSSPALIQVVKQAVTLTLSSGTNPAQVYGSVTFTTAITAQTSEGPAPAGAIVFSSDGSLLPNGTVAISNGSASYTTALLAAGKHTITAAYAGDVNDLPAQSNALTQVINLATSSTTLTTSNASVLPTKPVTLQASVSGVPASTPTGKIVFKDGSAVLSTQTVDNTGNASYTTSALATGSHSLTATYQGDADYGASTSPMITETVNQIATSTAITASANPADAGAAINFAVTVTAANSTTPNIAITGKVSLMEGSTLLGSGTLAASAPGTASVTVPVSTLAPGAHAITAIYAGDVNYTTSTSSALLETVTAASVQALLTAGASSVVATKPVTFSVKVTGNGGTPTGTVNFLDGNATLGSASLVQGVASYTTSTLAVGSHSVTASYVGDANDVAATSNAVSVAVTAATTTVTLSGSGTTVDFGQPFTLTAKVAGNGGVPTGAVTFAEDGTTIQTTALQNGTASWTSSTLTDGSHTFTASYAGDANDSPSVAVPLTIQVLETLNITVTSTSPNPSVARSNVHFVATLTALQGVQPTGSITFMDGTTTLGTGTLSGTTATYDTAALSVGTHSIVATYAGDSKTASFTSAPYTQTVNAAGASVILTASANPATFGTSVTFSATATSTAGPLTGTVQFQDGGITIGSGTLSSTGVAILSLSTLNPGTHSIVAAYQGDSTDQPANSTALQLVVERPTSTTLNSSLNPLPTLAPVTISATVTNGGTTPATGTVSFTQDGTAVGQAALNASGVATLSVASLSSGAHSFTATYSGDAVDLASTSATLSENVQLRPTTDVMTTSATSLTGGQQITLISVLHYTGPATPTGTTTFLSGSVTLGTAPVDSSGVATITVLLSGTSATLSSSYSGDASYAASISTPQLVSIGAAANFTLQATPTSFKMVSKEHADLTLTLGSVKDFSDTFKLGCLGLPKAATCTFSADQVKLGAGGLQTVTLTVDTGNPLLGGAQSLNRSPTASRLVLACFLPGGLLLGLLGMRSKRLRGVGGLLLLLCLAAISTGLTGCGGVSMGGTPAGTYNFNISAVGSTGVSQSVGVTMTVTQ